MTNKVTFLEPTSEDEGSERTKREQNTREKLSRSPATFVPAGLLPQLEDVDPDYTYRWVRAVQGGRQDTLNVSARMREGWVLVSAEEMPNLIQLPDPNQRFPGMVEHGGHVLCKISKEKAEARRKYYSDMSNKQMQSVDSNFMRENDRRMPLFKESESKVKSTG